MVEMAKSSKRIKMEEEFITLYRLNWGSTVGLDAKKVSEKSDRELEISLNAQRAFPGKFRDKESITYKW